MTNFLIVFGIAFTVFIFFAVILLLKDRPRKQQPPVSCCSDEHQKTGCKHCSGQVYIP